MKTSFNLRMFIVVATMTAVACSGPDESDEPKPHRSQASGQIVPPPSQNNLSPISASKFYTNVTTWIRIDSMNFMGLVSVMPYPPQFWRKLSGMDSDREIPIDNSFDASRVATSKSIYGGYFWATRESNMLLINYAGATPDSVPPFPLQIVIEF